MGYRTIPDIISTVEAYYGRRIRNASGRRSASLPRQIAMYLLREMTPYSLMQIGGLFQRHHSSVIFAIHATEQRMELDPRLKGEVDELRRRLAWPDFCPPVPFQCTGVLGTGI